MGCAQAQGEIAPPRVAAAASPSSLGSNPLASTGSAGSIRIVRRDRLYVSEPPPQHFGNGPNLKLGSSTGWTNSNWLKSRFHFSFAEYFNGPPNFGVLRVMNDDLVQPNRGFGTHPHRDMEIITFVVAGELTHKDSMGTQETLGRGSVQFMTAGTGVRHSEHNLSKDRHLRFIQSWVVPRRRGLPPNYGSMVGDALAAAARKDQWCHLVSDVQARDAKTPVQINQDCNVYVVELSPNAVAPQLPIAGGRQGYVLCIEGEASFEGSKSGLHRHDAAELQGPLSLEAKASGEGAMLLLFEMERSGDGRKDI